ncbi:MAG: ABC transporter substrate-binding protein [Candidatus Hodarchaeota archaeon]
MERKAQIAVGVIAIIAVAAIVGGVVVFLLAPPSAETTLVFGTMYGPRRLDPMDSWDGASNQVLEQVVETLVAYDYEHVDSNGDWDYPLIPWLAESWSIDGTFLQYTFTLKQGVTFHDGTPFDANAVKFTFDRMLWALNATGTNTVRVTRCAELYEFVDPITQDMYSIINSTVVNSAYSVTIILNDPFAPFLDLLTYTSSSILSPTSHPADDYIVTGADDILVGTGPFKYVSYETDVEVIMEKNENWWGGDIEIDKLVISVITNDNARNAALLSGDIHYLSDPMDELYDTFNLTRGIELYYQGQDWVIQYLGMNNIHINRTVREAISYAFDEEYLIDEIVYGHASRLKSALPPGLKYYNGTLDQPRTNMSKAREIMQSMGYGGGFSLVDDAPWIAQSASAPFFTWNYTYNIGNPVREDVLILMTNVLMKLGIRVEDAGMTWGDFLDRLYHTPPYTREDLRLYWIGWGPDYNDPINYINPLYTNRSIASNGAQYNGYTEAMVAGRDEMNLWDNVQLLMEAQIGESSDVIRGQMFNRIQELLVAEDFAWVYGYVRVRACAYVDNLKGLEGASLSGFGREYFAYCYFE